MDWEWIGNGLGMVWEWFGNGLHHFHVFLLFHQFIRQGKHDGSIKVVHVFIALVGSDGIQLASILIHERQRQQPAAPVR